MGRLCQGGTCRQGVLPLRRGLVLVLLRSYPLRSRGSSPEPATECRDSRLEALRVPGRQGIRTKAHVQTMLDQVFPGCFDFHGILRILGMLHKALGRTKHLEKGKVL